MSPTTMLTLLPAVLSTTFATDDLAAYPLLDLRLRLAAQPLPFRNFDVSGRRLSPFQKEGGYIGFDACKD
jgi:hypothetical protein